MEFPKPFVEILREARAKHAARDANPLRDKLEGIVRGMQAVSTHALLDLLSLPQTAENRRRIAATMRSIGGFVPIKSRRLEPGGWSDTVTRGWARPVRELRCRTSFKQGETVGTSHLNTPMHSGTN